MKLIQFRCHKDFGNDLHIQILSLKNWSLLQSTFSWNDYPSFPYIQISFGNNGFMTISFYAYKFGFEADILSQTWKWYNL